VSNFLLLFPEWKNLLFGERFLLLFPKWKNPLFLLFSSSIYSKLCFLLCRVLGVKLKDNAQSYKCKNYYGKKVWTVNAADVEWVECEHVNKSSFVTQLESQIKELKSDLDLRPNDHKSDKKTIKSKLVELNNKLAEEMNDRRFKLEPEQFSPEITVKNYHASSKKIVFRCKMVQIPANSNDATTGHKLQGMSKDAIIVSSWPTGSLAAMFKNWEYVVLSRVRTLSGLYLVKPIDMDKSFQPYPQLAAYMDKIRIFTAFSRMEKPVIW
jgi:hypothetical protein